MAQLESVNSEEANNVNFRKNTDVLAIMLVGVFPRREISQKKKKKKSGRQTIPLASSTQKIGDKSCEAGRQASYHEVFCLVS